MTRPDPQPSYQLRFSSSVSKPLASIAGRPVSVGQFRADVERLRARMSAPGDTLLSCSGRYAFSVGLLASWLASRAVILPPNQLTDDLAAIRRRYTIGLECDTDWAAQLSGSAEPVQHGEWRLALDGDLPAAKLFTSGSTGAPKSTTKTLANLLDEAHAIAKQLDWPAAPVVASVPPQHLYGLTFSLLLPWVLGSCWVDDMPLYPGDVAESLQRNAAGTLISVPAQYQALLDSNDTRLDGIRCVSAAAPLPSQLARTWRQRHGGDIIEIYGSTETGVIAHRQQLLEPGWQAFPGVRLSTQQDLLQVESAFVSTEFNRQFQTADRVTPPRQGRFELLGRADKVVKIAGKRISLNNIEANIRACSGVAEVAVIAVPAKGVVRNLAIWAAVVADQNLPLSAAQLRSALRDKLDSVAIPRRLLLVDSLPRTASGKLPGTAVAGLFDEHDRTRVQL